MIISASRRTDLPAFYSAWWVRRLEEGYCVVVHPFDAARAVRVSLTPETVDVIAFWSKNPAPLIPHLGRIRALGFRCYFLFTLNDYPPTLEPGIPDLSARVATFCRLADTVGPRAVIWRYDPIVLTRRLDPAYHRRAFGGLARRLAGRTERVIVSIVDPYAKARRRLAAATHELGALSRDPLADPGLPDLIRDMAGTAREHGLDISSCAEGPLVARLGVRPGRCIDADYIREVFGIAVSTRKDPGQRPSCGCVVSRDIGACDTCLHGCLYCYATASPRVAAARHARHDPRAPALGPVPEPAPVQVQASPDRPGSG